MNRWGPLLTRARGLAGHLLTPATMRVVAAASDRRAFTDTLAGIGYLAVAPNAPPLDERAVEDAIRRVAARRFAVLERWSRETGDVLRPVIADEERRSIRAIARGAMGNVPAALRTAGLVPTTRLPARALDELALLNDLGAIGAALLTLGHPWGAVVADHARRERPDPFALDQALVAAWAAGAVRTTRHGDRALRRYVERGVDLVNATAARLLAEQRADAEPEAVFVPGGSVVKLDDLRYAVATANLDALRARLHARVTGTPLAAAVETGPESPDDAAQRALLAEFRALARREPLGLAPALVYVMRLRAEFRALLRILWQLSLGVPAPLRAGEWETAA